MPTVPTITNQQVRQANIPGVGLQPTSVPTSGIAQATSSIASGLLQQAAQEKRKADQTAVFEATNALTTFENSRVHDAQTGILSMQGRTAFEAWGTLQDDYDTQVGQISSGLANDSQRRAFDAQAQSMRVSVFRRVSHHIAGERLAWQKQTFETAVDNARQQAIRAASDPNQWEDGEVAVTNGMKALRAEMDDLPVETQRAAIERFSSDVRIDAIDQLVKSGKIETAQQYFEQFGEEIASDRRGDVERHVRLASERVQQERINQSFISAEAKIGERIQAGDLNGARRELDQLDPDLPRDRRSLFIQKQNQIISSAQTARIEQDREGLMNQTLTGLDLGYLSPDHVTLIADAQATLYLKDQNQGLEPRDVATLRSRAKSARTINTGVDRLVKRFNGDTEAKKPDDLGSVQKFAVQTLEGGVPLSQVAQYIEADGLQQPQIVIDEIARSLDPQSLDLERFVSVMDALSSAGSEHIIGRIPESTRSQPNFRAFARTIYDLTRDKPAGSNERTEFLALMSRPDAIKWVEKADVDLVGTKDIEPIKKLETLTKAGIIRGAGRFRFNESSLPLDPESNRRFESLYRFHVARTAFNIGASPGSGQDDAVTSLALDAAVQEFRQKHIGVSVPTPGTTFSDPDFDTEVIVPRELFPDNDSMGAFERLILDPKLADGIFGMTDVTGPFNSYKGVIRPDLAISIKGSDASFIPVLEEGETLGYIAWNPKLRAGEGITKRHNKKTFDFLNQVMVAGRDSTELLADPRILWRPEYVARSVMDMTDGEDRQAVIRVINQEAARRYRTINGRDPDLGNADHMAAFDMLCNQIAQRNNWLGYKATVKNDTNGERNE